MTRFHLTALFALLLVAGTRAAEPTTIPLWEKGPPGFESRKDDKETRDRQNKDTGEYRVTNVHNPYVTVFRPPTDKATGTAVVIAPGGGHRELWVKHEGENVAEWLAERGITAVVLRHRLARETNSPYKIDVHALQDGQRALRLVRSKAKEWNIEPTRVGMMGFSAGGEVVAMVCRKAEAGNPMADDSIDRESAVPAFQALIYSGPLGIRGQTVTKANTPPTWIAVGEDDGAASWLVQHYRDATVAGVPAELHVYAKAPHGFGFRPYRKAKQPYDSWPVRFVEFLDARALLNRP